MTDYLARIPLTIDGNADVVRIYRSPDLDGDAAAQVNGAIAAIVAMAVEEDRLRRAGAEPPDVPPASACPACDGAGWTVVETQISPQVTSMASAKCPECGGLGAAAPTDPGADEPGALSTPERLPSPSWASRVAAVALAELGDPMAVRMVAGAVASQAMSGSIEHIDWVAEVAARESTR
jgi:hypothetical protein